MSDLKVFDDGHKIKTICYLVRTNENGNREVLLAMHRKQKKWNGIGGKVGDKEEFKDESVEQGAIRELKEEIGVTVNIDDLRNKGEIVFNFFNEDMPVTVIGRVFFIEKWHGEIKGLEVDTPTWFEFDRIPWAELWENDRNWFEPLLQNDNDLKLYAIYDFGRLTGEECKASKFEWV